MPKDGEVTTYVTLMVMEVGNDTPDLTTTANLVHVDQTNVLPSLNQNITCSIISPPSADALGQPNLQHLHFRAVKIM